MTVRPVLLALAFAGSVACGDADAPAPAQASPTTPAADAPTPAEPAPILESAKPVGPVELTPIPGGDGPGAVYFVINTKGVAKLDATGVTLVLDKPERNVQDLFVGLDGAVYLVDARSLRKLEGDAFTEVLKFEFDDVAPVDELALGPDGAIWVTGSRGSGRHDGGAWTIETREQLGLGYSSDIAVGFDGTAWLAGSSKLLRRGPGESDWAIVDTSALGRAILLLHMTASPAGFVVATNGKQLLRLGGDAIESTPLLGAESSAYTADLAIAADASIALASGTCELVRLGADGRGDAWRLGRDAYACETLEAMTIDARARIWVASREGLSVIDRSGEVVEFPAGSFAALAGRVSHIAVVGLGPELPSPPPVATATLMGKIEVEGKPLAKAKLEVCPTIRLVGEGSPCTGAPRRFAGSTDARGGFRLEQVAIGDYSVAVEVDGNWRWTSPPSFAADMRAGEVYELGALAVAK